MVAFLALKLRVLPSNSHGWCGAVGNRLATEGQRTSGGRALTSRDCFAGGGKHFFLQVYQSCPPTEQTDPILSAGVRPRPPRRGPCSVRRARLASLGSPSGVVG